MKTKKKCLVTVIGSLLMAFLLLNHANAAVSKATVPLTAMSGSKVTICHGTSSNTNPYNTITISVNGLNGHDGHLGVSPSHEDFFYNYTTGNCDNGATPSTCSNKQQVMGDDGVCFNPPNCNAKQNLYLSEDQKTCITPPTCISSCQTLNSTKNACDDNTWNGLSVCDIMHLNAKWGAEDYFGKSCEKPANIPGHVTVEWACPRTGGSFNSRVEAQNLTDYHCHFEVTGTGGNTGHIIEQQFPVTTTLSTQAKWDLINSKCVGTVVCPNNAVAVAGVCPTASNPTVTLGQTATTTTVPTLTGTVGTSTSLTIQVLLNGVVKSTGSATLIGTAPNKTWSFTPSSALAAGTYEIIATGNTGLTDAQSNELVVSTATTNTPTVDDVISTGNTFDTEAVRGSHPWISKAIEDTTPTITGTVGGQVLNNDGFAVTISKSADTSGSAYTHTYTKGVDAALTVDNGSTDWSLAIPLGNTTTLAAGVYEVNAVRTADGTATPDVTHNELIIGLPYCNGGVNGYILRSDFNGSKDAATYYLGACGSAVTKTPPLPYLTNLEPEKHIVTTPCTDAEGGGDRNTLSISTGTIKRATIINATTLGGTTTKNLGDTVFNYGERSGGTMDISHAVITNGVATNVTLTGTTINNIYLDIAGTFDISTGVFSPSDTYIGVTDGTVGVTQPSGDGVAIPKAQITDGVITFGTASNAPIRGRILSGFYNVNTSPTTLTMTKGRRTTGSLTHATITGATTTTASVNGAIKTVVSGGKITSGTFAVTSTFGTATNAKIENATITSVNSCFTSGKVGSRGQLNWREVIKE